MRLTVKNPNPVELRDCIPGNTCYFYHARSDEVVSGHFSNSENACGDKITVFTAMTTARYEQVPRDEVFLDKQAAEDAMTATKARIVAEYETKMSCVEEVLVFAYEHVVAPSSDVDEQAREAYRNRVMALFPNVRL